LAYFIDPKRALPFLQRRARAAEVGGAALGQGLLANRERAELYADLGFSGEAAREAFAQVAAVLPRTEELARIYGESYSQEEAEQEAFQGLASA
jgi:hypothetical protein